MMKKGFTLAETLTTLMIIGVIAALTIPTLNANIERNKTLSMLKKLYSSFNVNIETVLGEKNCSELSCLRMFNRFDSGNKLDVTGATIGNNEHCGLLADLRYFNVIAECTDCFPGITPDNANWLNNFTAYTLANGASMAIFDYADNNVSGSCPSVNAVTIDGNTQDVCAMVVFDTNGIQGPNSPGRDRFAFYIFDAALDGKHLIPVGYNAGGVVYPNDNTLTTNIGGVTDCTPGAVAGYNCTAKILNDDWQMDY